MLAASIADLMRVTGLQKGGIYNHLKSKDELAIAAFDYAIAAIKQHYRDALLGKKHTIERLQAIIAVFSSFVDYPLINGGCPLLNTAIESDDTHPQLRQRAQQAMNSWQELMSQIIAKGIEKGEIRFTIDPDQVTTIIIATLEGAMMLSKLYSDSIYMQRAVNHLNIYFQSFLS